MLARRATFGVQQQRPATPRATWSRAPAVRPAARMGGGNVLDRPTYDTSKDLQLGGLGLLTETGRDRGGTDRQRGSPPGGGNYRVLLLDSPKHTEKGVVKAITTVVPGTDEAHAANCFATSKQLGMAIVTSCLKEHAEFYAEQLFKYGCRASIEPDATTA